MADLNRLLKEEKEIVWTVVLVAAALLLWGWYFLSSGDRPAMEIQSRKNWHYDVRFSPEDFAFLEASENLDSGAGSPFGIALSRPLTEELGGKKEKAVPARAPMKKIEAPVPEKTAAPARTEPVKPAPEGKKAPKPAPAAPALEARLAQFVFYRHGQDGRSVAIVKMMNQSRKVRVFTLYSGLQTEGLTVMSISEAGVVIRDARGRKVVLEYRKPVRLTARSSHLE